jgi:hypothetical protein
LLMERTPSSPAAEDGIPDMRSSITVDPCFDRGGTLLIIHPGPRSAHFSFPLPCAEEFSHGQADLVMIVVVHPILAPNTLKIEPLPTHPEAARVDECRRNRKFCRCSRPTADRSPMERPLTEGTTRSAARRVETPAAFPSLRGFLVRVVVPAAQG